MSTFINHLGDILVLFYPLINWVVSKMLSAICLSGIKPDWDSFTASPITPWSLFVKIFKIILYITEQFSRSKILDLIGTRHLWNQSNNNIVHWTMHEGIIEEFHHSSNQILLNNLPNLFEKRALNPFKPGAL